MPDANTAKIAALNDHARQTFRECRVVITQAVAQLGKDDVDHILNEVRNYNDFTPINDPFLEHDFGLIQLAENTIFWKIDYYDLDLHKNSPDPSDPAFTARILTIMLAEEYWSQAQTITTKTQQFCHQRSKHCQSVELVRLGANMLFEHAVLTRRLFTSDQTLLLQTACLTKNSNMAFPNSVFGLFVNKINGYIL